MSIAENIKLRRIELNLSQEELATAMGYKSRSTIAKIESGENRVPNAKLSKFARVLGVSVSFLQTGIETEARSEATEQKLVSNHRKNIAVILAGGKSTRNMQNIPNQFINVLGKPVIIYCLEAYQRHPAIEDIYVVCLDGWKEILAAYAKQYGITKLKGIIPSGDSGVRSVKNAIDQIKETYDGKDIVVLQESTRPLITEEIISKLLNACYGTGSAVTCEPMREYLQFEIDGQSAESSIQSTCLNRNRVVAVQSPEAYHLEKILAAFEKAEKKGHPLDETCFAMLYHHMGYNLRFYEGNHNNLKVVRQEDLIILSALLKAGM